MDAQRLIEEQREKGYALAAKVDTAWAKVKASHQLMCIDRVQLLVVCWFGR